MSNFLITGASRGLGLELVRQLIALPLDQVQAIIAVTRSAATPELKKLIDEAHGRIVNVVISDITNEQSVKEALPAIEKHLPGGVLDVLVNNAGIIPGSEGPMDTVSIAQLQDVFRVNVSSVQAMTSVLLPLLRLGKTRKVINITTALGSLAKAKDYTFAPTHAYKISKSALNMLTVQYAIDFADQGFTFLAVAPGYLKTDSVGPTADLDVSVGAADVKRWILESNPSHNGKFVNVHVPGWENAPGPNQYDGKELPW